MSIKTPLSTLLKHLLTQKSNIQACYMYNEQTNAHFIDSLLYCSLFIAPACFNANMSSSGSSYLLPAKVHKRVHAVLVVFFLRSLHIRYLELLKL
jgi:hypothetical protein